MALRSPIAFHAYWGIFATYGDLPNVAGSPTQRATLQVGDQAYSTTDQMLYFCVNATLGAAIWSAMGFGPANFDAFGRLRTSAPQTIFDSKLVNDTQPLYWDGAQTGAAPAPVWNAPDACVTLSVIGVGTSVRQTKRYFNYQPGKSQEIFQTFNLRGAVPTVIKRVGYFDSQNGLFLELNGVTNTVNFVRRSGSSVGNQSVPQASWNLDPLDGSGPSGISIDFTKTQILALDFEWLGVGSIRMGFVLDGQIVYAQQFNNADIQTAVYMTTPNLPLRYELDSAGAAATLDCICGTVISEGGLDRTGTGFAYSMPAVTSNIASGVMAPLVALRLNAAYPRVTIIPTIVNPLAVNAGVSTWEFVLNPTFGGTPMAVGATNIGYCDTLVYADVAPTGPATATGGTVVAAGTFSNQSGLTALNVGDVTTTLPLVSNYVGTSDVFVLRVKNLTGGTERYVASLGWVALT